MVSSYLFAEIDFLPHVNERDFLRCGDDDCTIDFCGLQVLGDGYVLIRSPGWGVNHKVIYSSPVNILNRDVSFAVFGR